MAAARHIGKTLVRPAMSADAGPQCASLRSPLACALALPNGSLPYKIGVEQGLDLALVETVATSELVSPRQGAEEQAFLSLRCPSRRL